MPRGANPFYYGGDSQLGGVIGSLVGKALFGDPELAAKQALQQAQMDNYSASAEEARAHAGLYGAQTGDQQVRTAARRAFGPMADTILATMGQPAPATVPTAVPAATTAVPAAVPGGVAAAPVAAAPAAVVADAPAPAANGLTGSDSSLARAMIPLILSAATAQENPNIGDIVGAITAMGGGEGLVRRGMAAQGVSPSADFALTPGRADDIRQQGYTADLTKATNVANISAAATERGQDISAKTTMRGQDLEHQDRVRGQDLTSGDSRYATDVGAGGLRVGGWTPRFSAGGNNSDQAVDGKLAAMQARLGIAPDQQFSRQNIPQVFDAIASTEGADPKNNNPGNIVDGPFARSQAGYVGNDGNGFARFASPAAGRQAGISLLNVYYNRGQRNIRDVVEGLPVPGKPSNKAPPQLSNSDMGTITQLIQQRAAAEHMTLSEGAFQNMRTSAAKLLQKSGNPADAVDQVFTALKRNNDSVTQQALAAIKAGADPDKVKARFEAMTGHPLQGV